MPIWTPNAMLRYPDRYPEIAWSSYMAVAKKTKKRRVRSPHPGVVLIAPQDGHPTWRARYEDPDTGRQSKVRLDPIVLSTLETRRDWAIAKSKELARRRMELESGAPRVTGMTLEKVVERYYEDHPLLRDKTVTAYRGASSKLMVWAKRKGLESAESLTRARLLELRAELVQTKKTAPGFASRKKAPAPRKSDKPRSSYTINRELRGLRTVLGYVTDLDLLPKLSHDDLRRALKRLPNVMERMDFLKPHDLAQLFEAALRHDADVFAETREEHAAGSERGRGGTARYDPIAPFTAFLLLSGCRLGEGLALTWDQVELDALDAKGQKVGEIHLKGAETKTHKARTLGLEVSPALRALLAALKLKSGGKGSVFGVTQGSADAAAKRLRGDYPEAKATGKHKPRTKLAQPSFGAPKAFSWQALRRTCGTYLTNAPGIFEGASAYRSAKQLGHSVQVAETHYVGVLRGIPRDATSLEAAMQIETLMDRVIASIGAPAQSAPRFSVVGSKG